MHFQCPLHISVSWIQLEYEQKLTRNIEFNELLLLLGKPYSLYPQKSTHVHWLLLGPEVKEKKP